SVFLKGGDPVIPEWMGDYVPSNSMVGYADPSCSAPGNLVGLNGPWPRDKAIDDLGIVPTLTSITSPAGWAGPTLNSMCIQTMMGFHGMSYGDAVTACAGAPAVVPGYFNAWPIKKGNFIEGTSLPIRGVRDDPCGDMFTGFFGTGWYPLQSYCEQRFLQNQMRTCSTPGECVGSRNYCWAMPPFGTGGFAPVPSPDGKFWTPDLIWSVDFQFQDFASTDLYISSMSAPGSATANTAISVSDTTNKSGASSIGGGTATKIYLSTDNKYSVSDTYLGSRAVGAFGAGPGSSLGNTNVTIPKGVCDTTYYLIARADADKVVTEWNEGNNNRARAIALTGGQVDLYVSSMTAPGPATVG
ncbi:MAG: CARDB domain-containing protein, partial [Nitrospirota bacterium]